MVERILNYRAADQAAWRIHTIFVCIYALLFFRLGIDFYEGPIDLSNLPHNTAWIFAVKRLAGEFNIFSTSDLTSSLIESLLFYALLHFTLFLKTSDEQNIPMFKTSIMTDKILKVCRAFFYIAGALLLLLVLLRTSLGLYQDITFGRPQILIGQPPTLKR